MIDFSLDVHFLEILVSMYEILGIDETTNLGNRVSHTSGILSCLVCLACHVTGLYAEVIKSPPSIALCAYATPTPDV